MSIARREKVADVIREEVALLLQTELHDARLGFATITEVRMSADLKHARIFVSLLSEGAAREEAMSALTAARGFIRRRLAERLRLRHSPEITFALDTSLERGARIEELLHEVLPEPDGGEPE